MWLFRKSDIHGRYPMIQLPHLTATRQLSETQRLLNISRKLRLVFIPIGKSWVRAESAANPILEFFMLWRRGQHSQDSRMRPERLTLQRGNELLISWRTVSPLQFLESSSCCCFLCTASELEETPRSVSLGRFYKECGGRGFLRKAMIWSSSNYSLCYGCTTSFDI